MTKSTESKQIAFFAAEPVEIVGCEQECECSHCGRPLKVGVKLSGFGGVFGADCLAKAAATQVYYGKKWRYTAEGLRERGIIAFKGAKCMERHGLNASHFRFVLKTPLYSV